MTNIIIRPLQEKDVDQARLIFSQAFGTYIGVPDPDSFGVDRDFIDTRRLTDPTGAFVAEMDGEVVGSNFAVHWGSVGFFGPLTIRPDLWDKGIGRRLMTPVLDCFETWNLTHRGLYTFPGSTKHVHLYQKHGFWPRFLTAIMSKSQLERNTEITYSTFSSLSKDAGEAVLTECHELTNSIYPGLNLDQEILGVSEQSLGDTVLVRDGETLVGMAVCHCGEGTEAGADNCYIKFGAARPGVNADENFGSLLVACEDLAISRGLSNLHAGVNLARQKAHTRMLKHGFRAIQLGIAMHSPNEAGYSGPDDWVMDDWR